MEHTNPFRGNRNFVDIGAWKRGISQSHYESTDIATRIFIDESQVNIKSRKKAQNH